MANSTYFLERETVSLSPSRPAALRSRRGWLRRLRDAVVEAPQRDAEREAVRYLEQTGGKLTDAVEREIQDRLFPHAGHRLF